SRKWKTLLSEQHLMHHPTEQQIAALVRSENSGIIPSLTEMGFQRTELTVPSPEVADSLLKDYDRTRDIPSASGTSRLSVHLRFGTISIRELAQRAFQLNETFLNELIWRDFYMMIL